MLGDVPTAQDVIQNVFLRVHRAADRLDPERDPAPWLATITVNECRALWRSRAYRVEREGRSLQADDGLADRLSSDGTGPDRMVLDQEREAILQRAIEELPEQMRAVVLLHDYREFTHEEIATIVGASPAAVRKRYSRALERLREHLKSKLS
jgi:RNA polymerase sigma-70 factor (ECF subfamily)